MSQPHPPPPTPARPSCLAELSLRHLEREQAALEAALAALEENRRALLQGGAADLAAAARLQQEAAEAAADLRQHRDRFRQEAAAELNVPAEEVTLRAVAAALPGEAGARVADGRRRLADLAARVRQLAGSNASLLHTCLDFVQRFLHDLAGGAAPARYGPAGKLQEPACGPLLQARG